MTAPKCYDHRDRETAPTLCPTCNRIAVEFDIVSRTIDALIAAGFELRESYGEESYTTDRDALLALLFDLDDAFLIARNAERSGWVRFVFGNDGWDVISDYTVNLEDVLTPVNAYADTLQP